MEHPGEKRANAEEDAYGPESAQSLRSIQKDHILRMLRTTHGDVNAAAHALAVTPRELRRLMTELDISITSDCADGEQPRKSRQ